MTHKTWVTADLHLGHLGVCKFWSDGKVKLRPWSDPLEMDAAIIKMWNEKVAPHDKVYVLGDVVINRRCLVTIGKLNGRLILVSGNHDTFRLDEYRKYFEDIRGSVCKDGVIMTHIPIHPDMIERFGCNLHGHTHKRRVLLPDGSVDPRYLCLSLEQTHFAPILWEDALQRVRDQGGPIGHHEPSADLGPNADSGDNNE